MRGASVSPLLARAGALEPVDAAQYDEIFSRAQAADWRGCGIEPQRYVEDRLDRERVLDVLTQHPDAQIVLHRRALTVGQAPGVDPNRVDLVSGKEARDYPGRVYQVRDAKVFHVVGIPGEDWFTQSLHMLATFGVRRDQILVEGTPNAAGLAATDLDATLAAHRFDGVAIGTLGALTRAVERNLRARVQPDHAARCVESMRAHLADRVDTARPDKRARWEQRRDRLEDIVSRHADADARVAAIEAEPDLKASLAEQLRTLRDGAPATELPMSVKNGKAKVLAHRILEVDGKKHLLIHIGGAHGDLAEAAVARVLEKQTQLRQVAFYGTCGSFDGDRLPPDTFVRPTGALSSSGQGRPPVAIENRAALPEAKDVRHTNVSTLLEEHRQGLDEMKARGETVDIEGYHVARAVAAARASGRDIDFRMLLRVSDVADDPDLGAHRLDRAGTSDYEGRRDTEEDVVAALGIVGAAPSATNGRVDLGGQA